MAMPATCTATHTATNTATHTATHTATIWILATFTFEVRNLARNDTPCVGNDACHTKVMGWLQLVGSLK